MTCIVFAIFVYMEYNQLYFALRLIMIDAAYHRPHPMLYIFYINVYLRGSANAHVLFSILFFQLPPLCSAARLLPYPSFSNTCWLFADSVSMVAVTTRSPGFLLPRSLSFINFSLLVCASVGLETDCTSQTV